MHGGDVTLENRPEGGAESHGHLQADVNGKVETKGVVMIRFGLIALLCVSFALAGCAVPSPHHDGPEYDQPRGHRPPPPDYHPYWGSEKPLA